VRVQIEIVLGNPSDPFASRPPLLTLVLPSAHCDQPPAPGLGNVRRFLTVRSRHVRAPTSHGAAEEGEEQARGVTDTLMSRLICRERTERGPPALPQLFRLLGSYRPGRLRELQKEAPADSELGHNPCRPSMLLFARRELTKLLGFGAQPLAQPLVVRREPLNEGGDYLGIPAAGAICLTLGEGIPLQVGRRHLDDEEAGPK
jgi:hypothetical protein